jgi:hypothetical protein
MQHGHSPAVADLLSKISVFLEDYAERHGEVRTKSSDRINGAALAREMGVSRSTVSRLLRHVRNIKHKSRSKPYTMDAQTQEGLMRLARAKTLSALHDTLDRTYRIRVIEGGKKASGGAA